MGEIVIKIKYADITILCLSDFSCCDLILQWNNLKKESLILAHMSEASAHGHLAPLVLGLQRGKDFMAEGWGSNELLACRQPGSRERKRGNEQSGRRGGVRIHSWQAVPITWSLQLGPTSSSSSLSQCTGEAAPSWSKHFSRLHLWTSLDSDQAFRAHILGGSFYLTRNIHIL